MNIEIRGTFY